MCGGEHRAMTNKERGSLRAPTHAIIVKVPLHSKLFGTFMHESQVKLHNAVQVVRCRLEINTATCQTGSV